LALGKTVAELQATLTPDELESWRQFYTRWPFDDFHRFHRPAALVATSFGGGEMEPVLDWLQPPEYERPQADRDLFAAAGVSIRR
jgi:hypothetical protein